MSVTVLKQCPAPFAALPNPGRFTWLELRRKRGPVYGHAALADQGEWLEVHLELAAWGPGVLRALREDFGWVRAEAARRGRRGLIGMKVRRGTDPDPKWPKFTRLFGFSGHIVAQCAVLDFAQ